MPAPKDTGGSESLITVLVAFAVNVLIAVAKSAAAALTGSASLLAEAAHSWADTGNEIFLLIADRRSRRPPDPAHPFGHGREAYVWSLFAAIGLFVAGAAVSVTRGIQELITPEAAGYFLVGYVVLALSFILEAVSFLRSVRQARGEAAVAAAGPPRARPGHLRSHPAGGVRGRRRRAGGPGDRGRRLGAHQLTGSPVPDAAGSILVGVLLGVVAIVLINRNLRFLVGQEVDPRVRAATIAALLAAPEVARVTYLRLEIVGPRMVSVIGDVDLTGDDTESHVAVRLRALEAEISASPAVAGAVLSLSAPDEPSLVVWCPALAPPPARTAGAREAFAAPAR